MACNRNLTRACHSGPKQIGILKLRVVGTPIVALQPTACRSKPTLINTGQLETTHKECFNPHSTCWCRRRRTPSSCSQSLLHFRDSSAPQKGRAEASHIVALVSTITKTVGKLFETSDRTSAVICPSFHQSIITPLNDTFHLLPCSLCLKG